MADKYRKWEKLFEGVADWEGSSHPPELIPDMMETVRQQTLIEVRWEMAESEVELKAKLEEMKKRQFDMKEQIRQFMFSQTK